MTIRHLIMALVFPASLLCSCETEFDSYQTGRTLPVVYGVINPDDSLYQIRLMKSFIGKGNAYDFARETDSLYFPEAEVWLETFRNQLLFQSVLLEKVQIADRASGIFSSSPNYVYQTTAEELFIRQELFEAMGLDYNLELCLTVIIPGQTDTVKAVNQLVTPPRIINPRSTIQKVYFYGEVPFQLEWAHPIQGNYYEILVVVKYRNIFAGDEEEVAAEWILKGIEYNETHIPGGVNNIYGYYVRPETFYSHLAASIPANPEVKGRSFKSVDFIILTSDDAMREYNRISELADDYHGAAYSNVENGLGLFTSYNKSGVYNLQLGQREMDSLARGSYTKHLRFSSW